MRYQLSLVWNTDQCLDLDERGLVRKGKDTQTSCAFFSTCWSLNPLLSHVGFLQLLLSRLLPCGRYHLKNCKERLRGIWAEGFLMLSLCVQQVWLVLGGPEPVSPLGLSGLQRRAQVSCAGRGCTGADIPDTLWLKVIGIYSLTPGGQNSKPKCLQGYIPAEGSREESSVDFSVSDSKFMFQTRLLCQLKKKKKAQPKSWELCFTYRLKQERQPLR